jgi:hypothetical protein
LGLRRSLIGGKQTAALLSEFSRVRVTAKPEETQRDPQIASQRKVQ